MFWTVLICLFSILKKSQLEYDVCHLPYAFKLKLSIILNGDVFFFLAFFPHVNAMLGHWKTQVFKNGPKGEIFEIVGFSFTCGRTKTEVFEYDDVTHHRLLASRMLCEGCYGISIVSSLSCGRAKTILYATCGCVYFKNQKTKIAIFRNVWTGPEMAKENKKPKEVYYI